MRSRWTRLGIILFVSVSFFACSKPQQPADQSNANQQNNTQAAQQTPPPAPAPVEHKPKPEPLVVPSGTTLTVRLGDAIGSKISQPGQSFSATLANPVDVDGKTAIPAGANATGTVVDAKPLGRFAGGASLTVKLTSINVNGRDIPVETAAVAESAKGKGKRTGVLAGGGAGLGAVVGALAGGGKGAAIGALAGAGAGTAGAAFTGNKNIVLPAESTLSFVLQQSVEIKRE